VIDNGGVRSEVFMRRQYWGSMVEAPKTRRCRRRLRWGMERKYPLPQPTRGYKTVL